MGSSDGAREEKELWKRTWKMHIKGKLKHFVWRCYHNIIPTKVQLAKKGMQYLWRSKESLEQLFFKCSRAQIVWKFAPVNWDELYKEFDYFSWW